MSKIESNGKPDYSLEAAANGENRNVNSPEIKSITVLKVESAKIRCSKGDCDQDYAPG